MLLPLVALLMSCTKIDETPGTDNIPISWNIYSADDLNGTFLNDGSRTKALVNNYSDLKTACMHNESSAAEKIGVYGSYNLENKTTQVFDNADLWWWEKEDGNPYNDYNGDQSQWNYSGENKFWVDNADYSFRAYFPKSKADLQPGSGPDKLLVVYDTQMTQYDLLVASRNIKSRVENPVNLIFQHTLAALAFDFQFTVNGIKDALTACWLENTQENGFYTSSTLNYESSIIWPQSTSVPAGRRIYYWEPSTPLEINSTNAAKAYTTGASSYDKGNLYTENEGWLLVIPQTTKGPESLKLCFTTQMGGSTVYRAGLPATKFEPGNRYTYHIKISSTNFDVNLTIKEWNERKSSYDIDFNKQNN